MDKTYSLDFSEATPLPEHLYDRLYEASYNGIEVHPADPESPEYCFIPWDCGGPEIKGDDLLLGGGHGESGYGSVKVQLPKKDAKDYYRFELNVRGEDYAPVLEALRACGVVVTETA